MPAAAASVPIRAAEPADATAIAEVIRAAFEPYRPWLKPPPGALSETPETIAKRLAQGQEGFAAEAEGRIVGCILTVANSAEELYVGRLAVHPEWQGRGIATRLMAAAEEMARARGCSCLSLNVRIALPGNRALFERLGFHGIGDGRHPGHQQPTFTIMRKSVRR